jgi:hypothetical protein
MAAADLLSVLPAPAHPVLQAAKGCRHERHILYSLSRRRLVTSALALRKRPERLNLDSRPYSLATPPDTYVNAFFQKPMLLSPIDHRRGTELRRLMSFLV